MEYSNIHQKTYYCKRKKLYIEGLPKSVLYSVPFLPTVNFLIFDLFIAKLSFDFNSNLVESWVSINFISTSTHFRRKSLKIAWKPHLYLQQQLSYNLFQHQPIHTFSWTELPKKSNFSLRNFYQAQLKPTSSIWVWNLFCKVQHPPGLLVINFNLNFNSKFNLFLYYFQYTFMT